MKTKTDPKLDLVLERELDIPPEQVWKAWTMPNHLKQFFCPKPWQTVDVQIDLRPGGVFYSVMQSPEGQKYPNSGCYLEIVENKKLMWTDALQGDYRPSLPEKATPGMGFFTACILLEPNGKGGTKYTAIAKHTTEEARKAHEEMGFHTGWGIVVDQMVDYMKKQ